MWGHPDQEEGPRAFAEKRAPRWQPWGDDDRDRDRDRDDDRARDDDDHDP